MLAVGPADSMARVDTVSPLAYVFWHQPGAPVATGAYEDALRAFHVALDSTPIPGFLGSRIGRVPDLPWLPSGGYEDWYYVESFAALGELNTAAVDAAHRGAHQAAAGLSGHGAGGLYRLVSGDMGGPYRRVGGDLGASDPAGAARAEGAPDGRGTADALGLVHVWFSQPAGVSLAELQRGFAGQGALWQRQLVLGPAPEYCQVGGKPPDVPLRTTVAVSPVA